MPNTKFDAKSFNPEAFKYVVDRVPNLKLNELKKSKALTGNPDIHDNLKVRTVQVMQELQCADLQMVTQLTTMG